MTMFTGKRLFLASAAMLAMAAFAGCSKAPPEEAVNETEYNVASGNVATPPPVVPVPVENVTENAAAADPLPPEAPVPVDQQTLDDASATGMTAHVSRGEEPPPAQ